MEKENLDTGTGIEVSQLTSNFTSIRLEPQAKVGREMPLSASLSALKPTLDGHEQLLIKSGKVSAPSEVYLPGGSQEALHDFNCDIVTSSNQTETDAHSLSTDSLESSGKVLTRAGGYLTTPRDAGLSQFLNCDRFSQNCDRNCDRFSQDCRHELSTTFNVSLQCGDFAAKSDDSEIGTTFATFTASPEAQAAARDFNERQIAEADANSLRGHAQLQARVVVLMQYLRHPKTGAVMLTQEQIDAGLADLEKRGLLGRWAMVVHTNDLDGGAVWHKIHVDPLGREAMLVKPPHLHAVIELTRQQRLSAIAKAFGLSVSHLQAAGAKLRGGGRNKREITMQNAVRYLVHRNEANIRKASRGKAYDFIYPVSCLRSNFDAGELIFREMKWEKSAGSPGKKRQERKDYFRVKVGLGEMTLDEVREADPQIYFDDLSHLRQAENDYLSNRETGLREDYVKSLITITGASRVGKDVLARLIAEESQRLAGLGGQKWRLLEAAGENGIEELRAEEICWIQDARESAFRRYDEFLRFTDPNNSAVISARFHNRPAVAPRLTIMTSSCTPFELLFTFKRRLSSEAILRLRAEKIAQLPRSVRGEKMAELPLERFYLDEAVYRHNFVIEVERESVGADDSLEAVMRGLKASIFVPVSGAELAADGSPEGAVSPFTLPPAVHEVRTRFGEIIGERQGDAELRRVAVIKGAQAIARFVAAHLIAKNSFDLCDALGEKLDEELAEAAALQEPPAELFAAEVARFVENLPAKSSFFSRWYLKRHLLSEHASLGAGFQAPEGTDSRAVCPVCGAQFDGSLSGDSLKTFAFLAYRLSCEEGGGDCALSLPRFPADLDAFFARLLGARTFESFEKSVDFLLASATEEDYDRAMEIWRFASPGETCGSAAIDSSSDAVGAVPSYYADRLEIAAQFKEKMALFGRRLDERSGHNDQEKD